MILALSGWSPAAAENPKVGADGYSLVLRGKSSNKAGASDDTLTDTLDRQVQVYIYNQKTRVWPKVMVRSGGSWKTYWGYRGAWTTSCDPRLNALINKYAGAYGVDPALVRAVMRNESGFNPNAVSPKGAQGLMQLMPGTAARMGVTNPFDPEQNIAGGVGYLRRCLDRFGHNVPLAVAAYNAGPEAVAKYCTIPPYQETQLFVNNVLGTYGATGANPGLNAQRPGAPAAVGAQKTASSLAPQQNRNLPKAQKAPHHPRAKIIEVRSYRGHIKAISILKD